MISATRALLFSVAIMVAGVGVLAQEQSENPYLSELVAEFDFGLYCAAEPLRRDEAPGTASGRVNIVPALPEFPIRQLVVPAELGVGFGVLVRLEEEAPRAATITVTHPPYADTGVSIEQWETELDGVDLSLNGFSFDGVNELLPGRWTFTASDGETVIYSIAFEVVRPSAAPNAAGICAGIVVS